MIDEVSNQLNSSTAVGNHGKEANLLTVSSSSVSRSKLIGSNEFEGFDSGSSVIATASSSKKKSSMSARQRASLIPIKQCIIESKADRKFTEE